jgi:hypothetical protein
LLASARLEEKSRASPNLRIVAPGVPGAQKPNTWANAVWGGILSFHRSFGTSLATRTWGVKNRWVDLFEEELLPQGG